MKKLLRFYLPAAAIAVIVAAALLFPQQNGVSRNGSDISVSDTTVPTSMPASAALLQEIAPTASVEWRRSCKKCAHSYSVYSCDAVVGMTEAELAEAYPEWTVVSFSKQSVVLFQETDCCCPNHFVLKLIDGSLAVLRPNSSTLELELLMWLSTDVSTFPKEVLLQLEDGMLFDACEDVDEFIEALDS